MPGLFFKLNMAVLWMNESTLSTFFFLIDAYGCCTHRNKSPIIAASKYLFIFSHDSSSFHSGKASHFIGVFASIRLSAFNCIFFNDGHFVLPLSFNVCQPLYRLASGCQPFFQILPLILSVCEFSTIYHSTFRAFLWLFPS